MVLLPGTQAYAKLNPLAKLACGQSTAGTAAEPEDEERL
jgi:hypothetical protein